MKEFMNEAATKSVEALASKLLGVAVKMEKSAEPRPPKAFDQIEMVLRSLVEVIMAVCDDTEEAMRFADRVAHMDEPEFVMRAALIVEAFASFSKTTGGKTSDDWQK